MDLSQKLTGVVITKQASVQVAGFQSRDFTLHLDFSECTVNDVIELAARPRVITWQNANRAKGEQHMASLPRELEIKVMPIGSRGPVDVEGAFMSKMNVMDAEQINEYIKKLEAIKKAKAQNKK